MNKESRINARWIPSDVTETIKTDHGVIYLYGNGKPCALGYKGSAGKRTFNFRYFSEEQRAKSVQEYLDGWKLQADQKAKWADERNKPHTLKMGDILYASWGYDQTNIDFWQIVGVRGKVVDIRPIAGTTDQTGFMSGRCVAVLDKFVGDVIKGKRPRGNNSIPWKSYADMYPWDGKSLYTSWYA